MSAFYSIVAHLLIGLSIVAMFFLKYQLIIKAKGEIERIYRVIALSGGLLIFFGAKSSGVSMPMLMLSAMDSSGGGVASVISYIFPAIVGSVVTYLLFSSIKNLDDGDHRLVYFLIVISTLITLTFSDIYVGSFVDNSENANIKINISFLLGVIFTLLFRVDIIQSIYGVMKNDNMSEVSSQTSEKEKSKDSWRDKY